MKITAAKFRAMNTPGKNKYSAQRVCVQGIWFDSKREANRYLVLRQMQRDGKIRDLCLQVKIPLYGRDGPLRTRSGRHMRITVDFTYTDLCAKGPVLPTVYEDAKGTPTRDYEVRKSVAQAQGIVIQEV